VVKSCNKNPHQRQIRGSCPKAGLAHHKAQALLSKVTSAVDLLLRSGEEMQISHFGEQQQPLLSISEQKHPTFQNAA